MHSFQLLTNIQWTTALLLIYLDLLWIRFCSTQKSITTERGSQPLEELLVRRRKAVVDLIATRPECVASRFRKLSKAQRCVIGWHRLELDVTMPLSSVVAATSSLAPVLLVLEDVLSRNGANRTDFCIVDAKLGGIVQNWVNVQGRIRWLIGKLSQAMDKLFLQLISEVILSSEEDHTTLGNCDALEYSVEHVDARTYW